MDVTLKEVRLARKRAYDRLDYWLQKFKGMTIKESGLKLTPIPKDLKPSEYETWKGYYEGFTGGQWWGQSYFFVDWKQEPPAREWGAVDPDYIDYDALDSTGFEFDEEPVPPTEPEVEEPEPETYEDEPVKPFWEYDDYYDEFEDDFEDGVAPNSFSSLDEMIDRAFAYGSKIGEPFKEAIDSIMIVTGFDADSVVGLTNNMTDVWEELEKAASYINAAGSARDKTFAIGLNHLNTALSKLYAGFGLTYVRGM